MKKIFALIAALFLCMFALAGPAAASGNDDQPAENKKIPLCHYDGSNENGGSGKYSQPGGAEGISINAFLNAGHGDHVNDIYDDFSYTTKGGEVVPVEGRNKDKLGLLATGCVEPKVDEKIAKPSVVYADKCGTDEDVFSVAPGKGYEVGNVVTSGGTQSITVTLLDGFAWLDGSKEPVTFTEAVFTNVDCDLPETGGEATYNTVLGGAALAGVILLAGAMLLTRKRV